MVVSGLTLFSDVFELAIGPPDVDQFHSPHVPVHEVDIGGTLVVGIFFVTLVVTVTVVTRSVTVLYSVVAVKPSKV